MTVGPWQYATGGLGLALMVAGTGWYVQSARLDGCSEARKTIIATAKRDAATWSTAHATQEKSISDLSQALDAANQQSNARAEQYAAQKAESDRRVAELNKLATTSRARIAKLHEIARSGPSPCGVDDELREALAGL